tara:strand:+ start:3729 stop:4721 length:993 start_codon:yes stop_codon:yes gene_type:complete
MKLQEITVTILMLLAVGYVYKNYRTRMDFEEQKNDINLIKKYLIDENDEVNIRHLGSIKKPIIWLHIEYNYNSRNWCSFGSRSSYELNMPYIYLTIQSIVSKCGDDFHICILDDYSFSKILPDFKVDLDKVGEPIRTHLRNLALMKVLYTYGGIMLENSFICMKSLKSLQDIINNTEKPIVGEFINESNSNTLEVFSPSTKLIGCKQECPIILSLIEFLEKTNKKDYTMAQLFEGNVNDWLKNNIKNKNFTYILGEIIGTRIDNAPVVIDDLLLKTDLLDKLNSKTLMIYIDRNELLKRTRYNWFLNLSIEQIFNSRTTLAELFLNSLNN